MSEVIDKAVEALQAKMPDGFSSTAKFVIEDEGSIIVDENGVRPGDDEAEVVLTADRDTFEGMLNGDVNPTSAFMSGKLKIDGSMGLAMQLGAALA
ncbi:MAG: SCP2 sterol-binding domain-containing protein [Rhodobacteraceae bacterium]|nr:MAG: SCP2 sterol-binding domain-containing protein [Paracoccaceae bacterium]